MLVGLFYRRRLCVTLSEKKAAMRLVAALAVLVSLPALAQQDVAFDPGCTTLPFAGLRHPIDDDCGIQGKDGDPAKQRESEAKNNLCATGTPTWVTFYTFKKLKQATDKDSFVLGDDRSGAKSVHTTNPAGETIGEGSVVKFAAFVVRADTANKTSGGENLNCNKNGTPRNDIHIHLAPSKSTSATNFCKAVVAEMIPHLRPDDFNAGDLQHTLLEGHPVRITGHLLYDGNHPVRCDMTIKANSRASTWEIHPVYSVDVCTHKSLSTCDARKETEWTPLATWVSSLEDSEDDH